MAISTRSAGRRTTHTPADVHASGKRSGRLRLFAVLIGAAGTMAIWNGSRAGATVEPRAEARAEKPAPREEPAVAGRILDPIGMTARWATVRAISTDGSTVSLPASTGIDGRFKIGKVDATTVRVIAEHESGIVESAEIPVASAHNLVLVLEPVPPVRGLVLDDRNRPIARATVKAVGGPAWVERIATTDDRGEYALNPMPASVRSLVVWARGFETASVPIGDVRAGADIRLTRSRPIAGIVVDPWGQPVVGAQVEACEGRESEHAISNQAGTFELPATVIGCPVVAGHPRFSMSEPFKIRSRAQITLRLLPGGAIEGLALDERHRPLASASVGFESYGGVPANTDLIGRMFDTSGGFFRFDDLPPGAYVLTASAPDRPGVTSEPIQVSAGQIVRGVAIVFAPASEPSGGEKQDESEEAPEEAEPEPPPPPPPAEHEET